MDPDPIEIHHHEQLVAAVRDVALCVCTYYRELVRFGMAEEIACRLALGYQAEFLGGGSFGGDVAGGEECAE